MSQSASASFQFTTRRDGNGVLYYTPTIGIEVANWQEAQRRFPRDSDAFSVWAIFERPADYPEGYVLRESVAAARRVVISPFMIYATSLDEARDKLPPRLSRVPRQAADPPYLVETWL